MAKERYEASVLLGVVGDKIGFGNGDMEFFGSEILKNTPAERMRRVAEHLSTTIWLKTIAQGGISGLNMAQLNTSDDTALFEANLRALLSSKPLIKAVEEEYIAAFANVDEMVNVRYAGAQTVKSIQKVKDGKEWQKFPYDPRAGGSGGAMKSMAFGLAFHKLSDLPKLISASVDSCLITHPNGVAVMGSIASAFFTACAINNVPPTKWVFELIKLIETNKIQNYIKTIRSEESSSYLKDVDAFKIKLQTYIEDNFEDGEYKIDTTHPRSTDPGARMTYFHDAFSLVKHRYFPGAGSDDSIIIAYDSLLIAGPSFEKLVYYSMLHMGDSDTTGILAGSWYGAIYGFKNVPSNILDTFDDKEKYKEIAKNIYKRYH